MKAETVIISNWNAEVKKAQQRHQEQQQKNKQQQRHYFKEFRESFCDLFDLADFQFYSEMTGLKVQTLLRLAKYTTSEDYKKYHRRERDIFFRRQFYLEHGHSITKPFKWE